MNDVSTVDAIVIGSGAGGAAASYRLARAGLSVLLLEKGHRLPTDGTTLDIERVVHQGEFLSHEPWRDGRGRELIPEEHFNLGGKTKWYGAALLRHAPSEFEPEPGYGCGNGWPIGYADLAPYYEEIETLFDVRNFEPEADLERILARLRPASSGWRVTALPLALHRSIRDNPQEASHFDGFATVAGLKADSDNALLARLAGLSNLTIETGAEVIELLPAGAQTTRVGGVRLKDGTVRRAGIVLLAAGALHSPRLLERYLAQHNLTGSLPAAQLVGRRLKLHLLTALIAVSPTRKRDLIRKTVLLTHDAYPHSTVQPLGFDGELIGTLMPKWLPRKLASAVGRRAYGFFLQTEDGSHNDNRVIDGDDGSGGIPLLDYDADRTPASEAEHRRLIRGFRLALLQAGLPSVTRRIGPSGTAHACGTLPAGTSDTRGVVDSEGRVFGLESLYVVDGSVLPRSTRVNPSLTIFAWGLRVADHIARRHSLSIDGAIDSRRAVGQTEALP